MRRIGPLISARAWRSRLRFPTPAYSTRSPSARPCNAVSEICIRISDRGRCTLDSRRRISGVRRTAGVRRRDPGSLRTRPIGMLAALEARPDRGGRLRGNSDVREHGRLVEHFYGLHFDPAKGGATYRRGHGVRAPAIRDCRWVHLRLASCLAKSLTVERWLLLWSGRTSRPLMTPSRKYQ